MIKLRKILLEGIKNPRGLIQVITHLPQFIKLYTRLFMDPRVPLYLKGMLLLALIYLLTPVDLIPELLMPLLGTIDDVLVVFFALKLFLKKCPPDVLIEHVRAIDAESGSEAATHRSQQT